MAAGAAATSLSIRHIFGVNTGVIDNISFTDEDTIVYVAGHTLVLYNLQDKRQRFLQSSEITDCITCYSSGPGRRIAAIAERGEKPCIHVFDLRSFRRKKTFTVNDLISKEIISMQFSEDNQLLLTLTGAPDWTLMCWNWSRAKLQASINASLSGLTLYKCMFSPLDTSVATIVGKDHVKFYRIGEKDMRILQENPLVGNTFISFCWMKHPDDHLLAGTEEGRIAMFRSGEFVTFLGCSPGPNHPINSLVAVVGGVLAGSTNGQFFYIVYDETKDQALFDNQFRIACTINCNDLSSGTMLSLAICPKDERICALTSDGQLLLVPAALSPLPSNESIKYAATSFHGPKPITGMDVAIRKPLILTCSKDSSLRLWNFKDHVLELCKYFPEEMFSVAMHPTGLHCAIGFTDKVRIYHILVDDLRICMEIAIKGCRECKFNHANGNFLAMANGNAILVYDFYTGERVADLRGHNSKVRSIHWMPSGCHLLSCGIDGAVYLWSLDGAKRIGEFVQKGTMYTSVINVGNHNSVMVVGSDRSLRELTYPDLTHLHLFDAGLILTNIAMNTRFSTLIASTVEYNKPGYIRCYPYPITGEFDDYAMTNATISRMRLTLDDTFLVVVDEHGIVIVSELHNRQDRFQRTTNPSAYPELLSIADWGEEIIVTRNELEDYNTTVHELKTKVDELKLNNEYQLKLKDMNSVEKLKETTDKFVQELEIAKSRYEMLNEVRVDFELEAIEKLKYMDEIHNNNVQNMETSFQAQIMELVDKYQKLVKERDAQIERLDQQRHLLVTTHDQYVNELTHDYENKLTNDHTTRITLDEEKDHLSAELTEVQDQLEDDIDIEIDQMKKKYEEKLALAREMTLKYKGENGIMKKKAVLITRDIEDQKEEMKILYNKEKDLHDSIKLLEKEISLHKKEIKSRDVIISEKEKRIYELKKKNQELEKFKFVLDYKIRELKLQIEPRQLEITSMREKIKSMDEELEKYHHSNHALDTMIGDLRSSISQLQQEVKHKRMNAKNLENMIAMCRSDLQAAINFIQSPPELLTAMQKMVAAYGSTEAIKPRIDPEVENEYNRHRDYLSNSVLQLKQQFENNTVEHMYVNQQIREKNMLLIQEINFQRDQNRGLKNTIQADIGKIRHLLQSMTMNQKKKGTGGGGGMPGNALMAAIAEPSAISGLESFLDTTNAALNTQEFMEPNDILDRNRQRIILLRNMVDELLKRQQQMMNRMASRETLPPLALHQVTNGGGGNGYQQPSTTIGVSLPSITRAIESRGTNDGQVADESEDLMNTRPLSSMMNIAGNGIELSDDLPAPDYNREKPSNTYATEYQSPRPVVS